MFSVDFILSFFRFIVKMLHKRERALEKANVVHNNVITSLITKREENAMEISRAQAAQRKLREFLV